MPRYLIMQRCAVGAGRHEPPTPTQIQERVAAFNAWREEFQANLVDLGGQLKPGGKLLSASGVTDGPFPEAREVIGGFMVVAAESHERALEVVRACPGLVAPGFTTEIREIAGS